MEAANSANIWVTLQQGIPFLELLISSSDAGSYCSTSGSLTFLDIMISWGTSLRCRCPDFGAQPQDSQALHWG